MRGFARYSFKTIFPKDQRIDPGVLVTDDAKQKAKKLMESGAFPVAHLVIGSGSLELAVGGPLPALVPSVWLFILWGYYWLWASVPEAGTPPVVAGK